jgi:acetyl-CoA C-acetyltransferase
MGGVRTAVVGVGQTRHVSARHDVSMAGLVREAALEATTSTPSSSARPPTRSKA